MIKAMRDYLIDWEELELKARFNIEYLPAEPVNYTLIEEQLIDIGKGVGVVKRYGNGMLVKEHRVRLLRNTHYEEVVATNVDNSRFMKDFEKWISDNNKTQTFPDIEGILSIETTTGGYLESVSNDQTHAIYSVGIRITYLTKE